MKKLFLVLILLFGLCPIFAKTVQCVKKYQVYSDYNQHSALDVTPEIQQMINCGWRVVSITPVTSQKYHSNPTDYVIVLFEKEEKE